MPEKPKNFFEVLFKSAGAGLSEVGEKLPGAKQQERQNKIQTLMLGMQMQQNQRSQALHSLNMQMRKQQLSGLEAQTEKILRESAMTPEQLAVQEAQAQTAGFTEQLSGLAGILDNQPTIAPFADTPMGSIQSIQGSLPAGAALNLGGLK